MKIEYPNELTYYILTENSNYISHGQISTSQVLETIYDITPFTVYQDYLDALANYGITLNENII